MCSMYNSKPDWCCSSDHGKHKVRQVLVCVCVCVCARARERERERERELCVCERERERERARARASSEARVSSCRLHNGLETNDPRVINSFMNPETETAFLRLKSCHLDGNSRSATDGSVSDAMNESRNRTRARPSPPPPSPLQCVRSPLPSPS